MAPSAEAYARNQARHWLKALGINPDDVAKQYRQLAGGGSGRHKHPPVPDETLRSVELSVRLIQQEYDGRNKPKMTRKNAIRWFAEAVYLCDPQWTGKDPNKVATFRASSLNWRRSARNACNAA